MVVVTAKPKALKRPPARRPRGERYDEIAE
jgi:hypothetical protein